MRLQVVGEHCKAQPVDAAQWAQHLDAIVQVNQAEQWEREVVGCQQLQLQREGHHVRVSAGQSPIVGEVTEPAIGRQVVGLHANETAQASGG
ncbi:hypothetical protein D3C76_1546090 [compost metagenome]